jgi:hypothetical protein
MKSSSSGPQSPPAHAYTTTDEAELAAIALLCLLLAWKPEESAEQPSPPRSG